MVSDSFKGLLSFRSLVILFKIFLYEDWNPRVEFKDRESFQILPNEDDKFTSVYLSYFSIYVLVSFLITDGN